MSRKKLTLIGWKSRGGRAIIKSPTNIEMFPKDTNHSFSVPGNVSSAGEAIKLLRMLAISSSYKHKKVTPIYNRN